MKSMFVTVITALVLVWSVNGWAAQERVVQSTDPQFRSPKSMPERVIRSTDPLYRDLYGEIRKLYAHVADRMTLGENYVELPLVPNGGIWGFNRDAKYLHRFYYSDIIKLEIVQSETVPVKYTVRADAKKSYEHIIIPPYFYKLERRGGFSMLLAQTNKKQKAIEVYTAWSFLFGFITAQYK